MKFKKKPIIIEAFKWTGGPDQVKDPEWIINALKNKTIIIVHDHGKLIGLEIKTLEGIMLANIGDYIIKGINDEIYPCKPDIFEKTYEPIYDGGINE